MPVRLTSTLLLPLLALLAGCWSSSGPQVVVYTALDREFSEPILEQFERQTGIEVLAKYDVESTKTVGLTNLILQERERPRCDLFWNNEILHSLRLDQQGLLAAVPVSAAEQYPAAFRSPDSHWYGFAARARVLLVNTELVPEQQWPRSVLDLADEQWRNRCGIARPLFGTTATHAAVLFSRWGDQRADEFFRQVLANAQVQSGNKQVAQAVAQGQLAFGITDTDDAAIELDKGMPVAIVFPDQRPGQMGALRIPNTLAVLKGAPHPQAARRLLEFLLTAEVEGRLARSPSAQFPLHADADVRPRVQTDDVVWMDADFSAAARRWDEVAERLLEMGW